MAEITVNLTVDKIAQSIISMNPEELETLSLLLSGKVREIIERKEDFESRRIRFLSSEEVFDDVSG